MVPVQESDMILFPDGSVANRFGKAICPVGSFAGSFACATLTTAKTVLDFVKREVVDGQTYKASLNAQAGQFAVAVEGPNGPLTELNCGMIYRDLCDDGAAAVAKNLKAELRIG